MEEYLDQDYSDQEELRDWLDFADLFVGFCYEVSNAQKQIEEEQGIAVLPPEQVTSLKEQMQGQLDVKKSYIAMRCGELEDEDEEMQPPVYLLMKRLDLSMYEALGVMLGVAQEYGRHYKKLLPEFGLHLFKRVYEFLEWRDPQVVFAQDGRFLSCFLNDKMQVHPVLLDFLRDREYMSGYLKKLGRELRVQEASIPVQENIFEKLNRMYGNMQQKTGWILQISGEEGNGKHHACHRLCGIHQQNAYFVPVSKLEHADETEFTQWIYGLYLAERLYQMKIVLEVGEKSGDNSGASSERTNQVIERLSGYLTEPLLILKQGEDMEFPPSRQVVRLRMTFPDIREKVELWSYYLQNYETKDIQPEYQANRYPLNAGGIQSALDMAEMFAMADGRSCMTDQDIAEGVHQIQKHTLGMYATYIPAVFEWKDLIVEDQVLRQMHHICNQIQYRNIVEDQWGFSQKTPYGRAVTALFYGAPGTGKTMAVQVIARALGIDLFRVDLSQMVSKYIGETEKHISELFQKAQNINAILFFDEADALFAKRSEVQDANDRHANAQTAHLLQKIEEYDGIVIMATNLKDNIDDAFKRRIKFMVQFTFPTADTRKKLWKSMISPKAECEDNLDLDFYGEQFELSGSAIKEIIRNAAYIAASEQRKISNGHMKEALKMHYAKSGKILGEEEFRYLNI